MNGPIITEQRLTNQRGKKLNLRGRSGALAGVNCKDCGKPLVKAYIPGRGNVTAHRHGERKYCDMLKRGKK